MENDNKQQEVLNMQEIFDGLKKINGIQQELFVLAETFNKFGTLLNNLIQSQSQQAQQPIPQQQPIQPTVPIPQPQQAQFQQQPQGTQLVNPN